VSFPAYYLRFASLAFGQAKMEVLLLKLDLASFAAISLGEFIQDYSCHIGLEQLRELKN
jgi:hypothetical protein